jgi:hypothetical protein
MTDESRLSTLLKSAMPPVTAVEPSRDVWALVTHRPPTVIDWSRILDLGIAAATVLAAAVMPNAWLLVAYHF